MRLVKACVPGTFPTTSHLMVLTADHPKVPASWPVAP